MRYVAAILILLPTFWPGEALAAININSATFEELDALPGVGEVTANRLIDHRESTGAFSNIGQVCALVGTNGVGVDTETCKKIEAEIHFGALGSSSTEEDAETDAKDDVLTRQERDEEEAKPISGHTLKVPAMAYAGQLVQFDVDPVDGTDGRLVRYSWNFGDGQVSSEKSPAHQYTRPGTYVVALESYFQKETKLVRREIEILPLTLTLKTLPGGGVEVVNEGEHELDLSGLSLNGDSSFTFAKNTILLPAGRLVLEGMAGPSVVLKDALGKVMALADPSARSVMAAPVKRAPASSSAKAPVKPVAVKTVATSSDGEATTTPTTLNTAAAYDAAVPMNNWPYLGLLAVMAFGFVALFGAGKFT